LQHTELVRRVEIVVIGGGIVGLLIALELTERHVEVTVLEGAKVASGASGGLGTRGVRGNGRHELELPLLARAYELWPQLETRIGGSTGYEQIGQLHVTEREQDLPTLADQAARQVASGVPSKVLDAAQVRALEPEITRAVVGAVWCPRDGVVDHTATTVAVAEALARRNVVIAEATRVASLAATAGGVVVEPVGADPIVANKVVVAANASAALLATPLGFHLPIFEVLPQVILVAPPNPGVARHLIGHAHRRVIVKSLGTGGVMVTGGWLGQRDPATGRGIALGEQVRGNLAEAVALYPALEHARVLAAVADRPEGATPDLLPVIDRDPDKGRVIVAAGWSGHGFALAPAVAEAVAEWITTSNCPRALAPFTAARFGTR
jgi:sarcosine oxidase subunit beta